MINKIKTILEKGVGKDFPGAQFCYIEGKTVKCDRVGFRQLKPKKVKTKRSDIYDIASLSKIVSTTTLILQLIDLKVISYDTKVSAILPRYKYDRTTINDLLTHKSGFNPLIKNASTVDSKKSLLDQIYNEKIAYEPGTKIVYSDTGYMLLGFIIEKIYDKKLSVVAREQIFDKLNMKHTSYHPNKRKAVPTEFRDIKNCNDLVIGDVHDERAYLLNGESGHAGVFSTANDISKYILSFLHDEKILLNKTKEKIFNTTIMGLTLKGTQVVRSVGFQKFTNYPETYQKLITHTGFTGCNMWIDREAKRGFVMLSNAIHPNRKDNNIFKYREEILNLFYNKKKESVNE